MKNISREELKKMMDSNGQVVLVEVLPPDYFNDFHLPGAINVPVGDDFEQKIQEAVPDKSQSVVVYCANTQCPASVRAAEKMDALGYQNVYDYEDGKEDWQQAGEPTES